MNQQGYNKIGEGIERGEQTITECERNQSANINLQNEYKTE